ncbi:hypothetical protein Glove_199g19 [Diversispora epigaea]|uniref:Uncharacterized protein n=1 Tax=Diversispora epigaea TaxID=1348612 RepID=A0A397IT09_9GLOM|nr:hypothetical protein Glove_199g19 [Diversispora epigaea]
MKCRAKNAWSRESGQNNKSKRSHVSQHSLDNSDSNYPNHVNNETLNGSQNERLHNNNILIENNENNLELERNNIQWRSKTPEND